MTDEDKPKTFVIAEIGVNHDGSLEKAFQLIDAASNSGADAVKFQTFDVDHLVTLNAEKAEYQQVSTSVNESQYQMLKKLQLDFSSHFQLKDHAEELGLQFISTAFDQRSLRFLTQDLNLPILKISSGEITNGPLLLNFAETGRKIILSTGMSTLKEVRTALSVLAFGLLGRVNPTHEAFLSAFESQEGQQALKETVTLLHCTTEYPAPMDSVNLKAMITLSEKFGLQVGYSDHTLGCLMPAIGVALGASVIEKHLTLDRTWDGPDHSASLEPVEFRRMVEEIRSVESAMGTGEKAPHSCEVKNLAIVRKSLVAARRINRGAKIQEDDLIAKRAGKGRSPMEYWDLVDSDAIDDFEPDDLV